MNRNLFLGYVAIAIGIGLIELSQDYHEYLGFRLLALYTLLIHHYLRASSTPMLMS